MAAATGMRLWTREASMAVKSGPVTWTVAIVYYDDGSSARVSWVDDEVPPHLDTVPVLAAGGRDAGGRTWGVGLS